MASSSVICWRVRQIFPSGANFKWRSGGLKIEARFAVAASWTGSLANNSPCQSQSNLCAQLASCRPREKPSQFRLLIHTAAYWLLLSLRSLAARNSFWREAQFDTIRLCLIKVAGRVTEMVTRIKIALPTAYPYQAGFAMLTGQITKLPP